MKIEHNKWVTILMSVIISIGFVACGGDDKEEEKIPVPPIQTETNPLIGYWVGGTDNYKTYTFNRDGTGKETRELGGSLWQMSFKYDIIAYDEQMGTILLKTVCVSETTNQLVGTTSTPIFTITGNKLRDEDGDILTKQ